MDIVPGDIDIGLKDEKGNLISIEASEHMALYRIRCNECHKNWCTNCRAQPYHFGKTCIQNEYKECRFCQGDVLELNTGHGHAFKFVCK